MKDVHSYTSRHPAGPSHCCAGSHVSTFSRLFLHFSKKSSTFDLFRVGIFRPSQSITDNDVAVYWP